MTAPRRAPSATSAPSALSALSALSDGAVVALAETFKVLGDTTRVRLLDALSRSERCVGDLAARLGLTQSAVSHQLRLLRGLRLVRPRRDGRLIFYALDDDHVVKLFKQGLEHVEESARSHAGAPGRSLQARRARQASAEGNRRLRDASPRRRA